MRLISFPEDITTADDSQPQKMVDPVMYPTGKPFYLEGGSVVTSKFGDKSELNN